MKHAERKGGSGRPTDVDLDVLVVGAGQAGLASAYHLRQSGLRFAVLEAAPRAGGSWPGYYNSLRLFSPARYSALPGLPFPGDPGRYPARDEVVAYLRAYAERFALPVLGDRHVVRVEPAEGWFLIVDAQGRSLTARGLIAATGSFHRPHHPAFPGQETFSGRLLHAADYREPEPFRGHRVVMVGGANSAVQIAVELAAIARVSLATRAPIRFWPQRILGRDIHFWSSLIGVERLPLGQWFGIGEVTPVLDDGRYAAAIAAGRPDRRPVFSRFVERGVVWADGSVEPVDAVILATGYRPNLDYLAGLGALRPNGEPDQRGGPSRVVPGLGFVGLAGQRTLASATLRGVGPDAAHVVAHLSRRLRASRTTGGSEPSLRLTAFGPRCKARGEAGNRSGRR